ncbi:hypothetical protein BGZ49_002639, partial [Haplosporangium sp. Z 27]
TSKALVGHYKVELNRDKDLMNVYKTPLLKNAIDPRNAHREALASRWMKNSTFIISKDPPCFPSISEASITYLETFNQVQTIQELESALQIRPVDSESQLVHQCLLDWLYIFQSSTQSPFAIAKHLPEKLWQGRTWGLIGRLAQGVENCLVIPGDLAGIESTER